MKKRGLFIVCFLLMLLSVKLSYAQCSICTKTAMQLGDKPARGMNSGVIYLAFAPFAIAGYIGYRWWKNDRIEDAPAG